VGVDQIDGYSFAFQQVIIKMYDLAILGNKGNVGEIIRAPMRAAGLGNVAAKNKN
jgi:hypothetical protein